MHAESQEAEPHERSLERLKERISFLNRQEKEIKEDIDQVVNQDTELKKEVKIISSIPGVGELTAIIILAETNGFELIRNKKQLSSYAGFDVKEKQGGARALWYFGERQAKDIQKRKSNPKEGHVFFFIDCSKMG